jgi:hypothetical protein
MSRPRLVLIQGGKPEQECRCDDSDVYDGYAECPAHPAGGAS